MSSPSRQRLCRASRSGRTTQTSAACRACCSSRPSTTCCSGWRYRWVSAGALSMATACYRPGRCTRCGTRSAMSLGPASRDQTPSRVPCRRLSGGLGSCSPIEVCTDWRHDSKRRSEVSRTTDAHGCFMPKLRRISTGKILRSYAHVST